MARDTRDEQMTSLEERLTHLERLLEEQRARNDRQEAELARLRAPTAVPPAPERLPVLLASPSGAPEPAATNARPAGKRGRKSRRALLKLGGAAAAAGVAAVATELAHPGTAHANGVAWQTGVVNSDNQTYVEPANGSFPDTTLLTLRLGARATCREGSQARVVRERAACEPTRVT
jgi:hypothetical protein